jgi:hypothetical protein
MPGAPANGSELRVDEGPQQVGFRQKAIAAALAGHIPEHVFQVFGEIEGNAELGFLQAGQGAPPLGLGKGIRPGRSHGKVFIGVLPDGPGGYLR